MRSALRRPGLWITAFGILIAAVLLLLRARGPTVTTTLATHKSLEQHIVASGRVWVPARVQISTQTQGLVLVVGAIEGQRVKKGDLLVELDDAEARAAVAQAKAAVDQALARVDHLRKVGSIVATETNRQAETNLARSELELVRIEKLAASGSVTRAELDDARRNVDIARAQKNAAEAAQIAATPMGTESRVALGALLQAKAQLTSANARLAQTRIEARHDGIVLERAVEPGDVVQPGRTLLVLATDGEQELVIEPDERSVAWIRLGQGARASADAYPQETFDATVSYIAPSIDPQRGSIEVRLRVPKPPAFLKPDMTVSVDLTVATKESALVVPSTAVHGGATPSPWLLAVLDGRTVRREVKTGIHGEGFTEILEGVAPSEEVVVPTERTLSPGQRVRTKRGGP